MIKLFFSFFLLLSVTSCGSTTKKSTIQDNNPSDIHKIQPQQIVYHDSTNIPALKSGYGSFGTHEVAVSSISNSAYPSKNLKTTLYYPKDLKTARPTLFFYAGASVRDASTYQGLFYFVASKGYNIIFITYADYKLRALPRATQEAINAFSTHIDKTKVGFLGHSMGAGVAFWMINQLSDLGSDARILFPMASGYSAFNVQNMIPATQTISLPQNTKLFLQMYAKDYTTDIRIGMDLFLHNSIQDVNKEFIFVYGDANHSADHGAMAGSGYDGMRQRTIYRPLDALMDEAFNHNPQARATLKSQSNQDPYFHPYIGTTPHLDIDASYILPEASYPFNCSEAQAGHYISVRKAYCQSLGL